jgi:peroxiredoxin Q/BCP
MKIIPHWLGKILVLACAIAMAGQAAAAEAKTPKAGDKAPPFKGKNQDGKTFNLEKQLNKHAVLLYFYPKDNTPGCTKEACGLRDRIGDLKKDKIKVVGVSMDDAESHKKFIADHHLNFALLADTDGKITDLYGARMAGKNMSRRVSFLISKDGTITHVTDNPSADVHLSEMQDAAAKLVKK